MHYVFVVSEKWIVEAHVDARFVALNVVTLLKLQLLLILFFFHLLLLVQMVNTTTTTTVGIRRQGS